jgi:hypothetical protein
VALLVTRWDLAKTKGDKTSPRLGMFYSCQGRQVVL